MQESNKIEVGDVFYLVREFDEIASFEKPTSYSWRKSTTSYVRTKFFERNSLRYLEIVDTKKFGRKRKFKVRLFLKENKKIEWSSYRSRIDMTAEELTRWLDSKVLKGKIQTGHMIKSSWGEIAKEQLLENISDIDVNDNTKIR